MIVSLSIMAACFGRYSHTCTPGSFVRIVPKGPRISLGIAGLTSQVSMWLGPPVIQMRITLLRRASGAGGGRLSAGLQQGRQRQPCHAGQRGLEHAAPGEQVHAVAQPRVQLAEGVGRRVAVGQGRGHGRHCNAAGDPRQRAPRAIQALIFLSTAIWPAW